MTLGELLAPEQAPQALTDVKISAIARSIGRVTQGSVFVITKKHLQEGAQLAHQAVKAGAAAVVTQEDLHLGQQVLVEDTSETYARLCANWFGRPAEKLKLLGVTGTNGKTTVTHMLKGILEQAGYRCGLVGTIGNETGKSALKAHNTTPDAFELHSLFARMVEDGCGYAVMEVSSHALDQGRVAGLTFEAGVFTNLTQDHLDYHKTMQNYMLAKRRLFVQSKQAVLNLDDPYAADIAAGLPCRKATFSIRTGNADYFADSFSPHPQGIDFNLITPQGKSRVNLKVPGEFSVSNALAAAACALRMGIDLSTVTAGLNAFAGVKGRMELVPTGRTFTVAIDYAHTPDGLKKVIEAVRASTSGRVVVVFGCGGDRDHTKRPLMGRVVASMADYAIITSDNPRTEEPKKIVEEILEGVKGGRASYTVIVNREEAIRYAVQNAKAGDFILLAGKGHETYQILRDGVIALDEREIVAQALKEPQ